MQLKASGVFYATFATSLTGCAAGLTITKQSLLEEQQAASEGRYAKPSYSAMHETIPVEISGKLRQVNEVCITDINSGEVVLFDEYDFPRSKTYYLEPGTYKVKLLSGKDTESSITISVIENRLATIVLTPSGKLTSYQAINE